VTTDSIVAAVDGSGKDLVCAAMDGNDCIGIVNLSERRAEERRFF
jgi:hypothetical protein